MRSTFKVWNGDTDVNSKAKAGTDADREFASLNFILTVSMMTPERPKRKRAIAIIRKKRLFSSHLLLLLLLRKLLLPLMMMVMMIADRLRMRTIISTTIEQRESYDKHMATSA